MTEQGINFRWFYTELAVSFKYVMPKWGDGDLFVCVGFFVVCLFSMPYTDSILGLQGSGARKGQNYL